MQLTLGKFSILDERTRDDIYTRALEILRVKGLRVHSVALRGKLKRAGAQVDDATGIVTLPAELVRDAIGACPNEVDLYDLDGKATRFGPSTILDTVGTYVEAVQWLDYGVTRLRPSRLEDLERGVQLGDALTEVAFMGTVVWPMDVPVERQLPVALLTLLKNSRKMSTFGVQNEEQLRLICDALAVAADGMDISQRPPCTFVSSPTSPLTIDADSGDVLICGLDNGLVPDLAPCPMAGGTSQFSIIGTILQQVVENLFMTAAAFAVRPGTPVIWGGAAAAMDMKAGDVSYGGIERSLMMIGNIDMAEHFGLPCRSPAGSMDSCLIDAQCGAEKTWTYLTRVLSRAATGLALGGVTNGKAVSLEQMVIDADILNSVRRLAAGIETDRIDQADKEIRKIDHGGNFMMAQATMELLREGTEYYYPKTFNRAGTDAPSALERTHEQVEQILADWQNPVPEKVQAELEKLLRQNE